MTRPFEASMDWKERRAGIAKLVRWIAREVESRTKELMRDGVESLGSGVLSREEAPVPTAGPVAPEEIQPDDTEQDEVWACESFGAGWAEMFCAELRISRRKLNALIREYRGISALELIDGFRTKKVKAALAERVRACAEKLWLSPGNFANVLVSDGRLQVRGGGSQFFVDPAEDWRRADLWETRADRMEALLAEFEASWSRGDASKDGFAVSLGFRQFEALNRACLNVFGKTVRELAYGIMGEVVDYYLVREEDELRELACCEAPSVRVIRARFLYHGETTKPEGDAARMGFLRSARDEGWLAGMGMWLV